MYGKVGIPCPTFIVWLQSVVGSTTVEAGAKPRRGAGRRHFSMKRKGRVVARSEIVRIFVIPVPSVVFSARCATRIKGFDNGLCMGCAAAHPILVPSCAVKAASPPLTGPHCKMWLDCL